MTGEELKTILQAAQDETWYLQDLFKKSAGAANAFLPTNNFTSPRSRLPRPGDTDFIGPVKPGAAPRATNGPVSNLYNLNSPHAPRDTALGKKIADVAVRYGIDAPLLLALISVESNYNQNVVSHVGARGLTQLMPGTAAGLGVDPRNLDENLIGGARYLAAQLKAQNGNITLALAAYNAGPGNVRKYGGVPPFRETQNYVKKVTERYQSLRVR